MRLFWILAIAALGALASAQGDFLHRPSPFAGRTMLTLSLFEEVKAELKTTPDENTKVDALVTKLQGDFQDTFQSAGGDFDAIRAAIDKLNAKYDADVEAILTPDQDSRLKQLFIQYNGAGAIANAEVSKDLGLTDDQKAKIKSAQDDNAKAMREALSNGAGQDEARDTFDKLRNQLNVSLDKILTDDQRTRLKTMEGSKFEFKKVAASA